MKTHLLVIDPQRDFTSPTGSLFVTGADQDMNRLAKMISRLERKIDDIHITLDSHQEVHIAHPCFWVNSAGNNPSPFTLITEKDVVDGVWMPKNPHLRGRALNYVKTLSANSRYILNIWPQHCIIGSTGAAIDDKVFASLSSWAKNSFKRVDFVPKGSNCLTEHYSAVQADVIDSSDPTTMLNTNLIQMLSNADVILIAGEALSHCVANTITDIANSFGEENIKKFVLLEDCCSNVGGFEKLGADFVSNMTKRGMKVAKSTEYLA